MRTTALVRWSSTRVGFLSRSPDRDSCGGSAAYSPTDERPHFASWVDGLMQRSFPADLLAPAAARGALERLESSVGKELLERSALVVTEVVTNSVQQAGLAPSQQIELTVSLLPELLRIEVLDDGPGFIPVPVSSKPDKSPGGWGLWLVDQLTDRWGVDGTHSTSVWLEFDRSATRGSVEPSAAEASPRALRARSGSGRDSQRSPDLDV